MGVTQEKAKKQKQRVQWIVEKAVAAAKNELMEKMNTVKKEVEDKVKGVVVQAESLLRGAFHFVLLQGERLLRKSLIFRACGNRCPWSGGGPCVGSGTPSTTGSRSTCKSATKGQETRGRARSSRLLERSWTRKKSGGRGAHGGIREKPGATRAERGKTKRELGSLSFSLSLCLSLPPCIPLHLSVSGGPQQ